MDEAGPKEEEKFGGPGAEPEETRPIADFFPEATILFADIRGFTAWCRYVSRGLGK